MSNHTQNNILYYAYYKNQFGEYTRIGIIHENDIKDWLTIDGKIYSNLKLVKNSGNYMILENTNNQWDVVDRGVEDILFHEKSTFNNFTKDRPTDKKIKHATKDKPLDQRHHYMKPSRGTDRKNQNFIPKYRSIEHNASLPTSNNILKTAKAASSGAWKLSKYQVIELARKYKFNVPTAKNKSKHLGSTGILMWRKSPKDYYLVKFSKHHKKNK